MVWKLIIKTETSSTIAEKICEYVLAQRILRTKININTKIERRKMLHPREDYARIQDPAGLIPENEPVFLLRAQDKIAVDTVRFWAMLNKQMGGDPKLSEMAFGHAHKMDEWPVKKLADLPTKQKPEKLENKPDSDIAEEKNSFVKFYFALRKSRATSAEREKE